MGFLGQSFTSLIELLNPVTFLKGVTDLIGNVIDFLNPFSDNFILNGVLNFLSYLNPFSDNFILKDVLDFFATLLSYLNPFSDNFIGKKIVELLGELLESLFVPSEDRINALTNTVKSKFEFIESIKIAINSLDDTINNLGNSPKLTLNLGATKYTEEQSVVVLDLSWYAPFKPYGDLIITGFVYLFFLWRVFITLPNIINGVGGAMQADVMVDDIKNGFRLGDFKSSGGVYKR